MRVKHSSYMMSIDKYFFYQIRQRKHAVISEEAEIGNVTNSARNPLLTLASSVF